LKQVIIDTNILISAFLWGGVPNLVLTQCLTLNIQILRTDATFDEFVETLNKPKFDKQLAKRELTRDAIIDRWRQLSTSVSPADVPQDVIADLKDVIILAAAAGGDADAVITGDDHLLRLITFGNAQILTAAQFLELVQPSPAPSSSEAEED
jgi:uncharacterized protein